MGARLLELSDQTLRCAHPPRLLDQRRHLVPVRPDLGGHVDTDPALAAQVGGNEVTIAPPHQGPLLPRWRLHTHRQTPVIVVIDQQPREAPTPDREAVCPFASSNSTPGNPATVRARSHTAAQSSGLHLVSTAPILPWCGAIAQ